MFPASILSAHSPEYRRKSNKLRELELEINHLAHGVARSGRLPMTTEARQKELRDRKIERTRLQCDLSSLRRSIEQEIIMMNTTNRS